MKHALFVRRYSPALIGLIAVLVLGVAFLLMLHTRLSSSYIVIVILSCALMASVALLITLHQLRVLARMNEERSGLLQLTCHQLGGPITILQWSIEALEETKDNPVALKKELPQNLVDMREGVRRLASIIDTLQEAEKVELGLLDNSPVNVSLPQVLSDALAMFAPSSEEGKNRLKCDAPDIPCMLDPHLLTIVLRRLVENALEYSSASTVVRVRGRLESNKRLCIDIEDDGCGVPISEIRRLCQKYFRASNASTMKPDGNGLGLYIVRGIVQLMGGTLELSSIEHRGTTVTICLPCHAGTLPEKKTEL